MKQVKSQTNLEQIFQAVTESTEETICGGGGPAGGGDNIVFDMVDSVAQPGSGGTLIPVKIKHNA